MGRVILIEFSTDLPTAAQNELRYRMEMAAWKADLRAAKPDPDDPETWDWNEIERLDRAYNYVGLP